MWLDRLSGNSTPAVSPAPGNRRPLHLAPSTAQRPSYGPRSSSLLSLASTESASSAQGGPRKPNGSGLKHSVTIVDAPDPVEVLEKLLKAEENLGDLAERRNDAATNKTEEEIDEVDIDFEGLSLRELAGQAAADSNNVTSTIYKPQTVEEYERDKAKFEDLHRSIRACDDVLNSVENNLTNFKNDLEAVSAEIETLQARSTNLNTRLENRKLVEKALGPIVEEISVAPAVVKKISEGPIDEGWVRALAEVEKRSKALENKSKEPSNIKGITDLKPLLDNLINKALERIRDFLVLQIKGLRSPNINAQIIQRQHFLKYKDLYTFLARHHPQLASEIAQAYMNTMRWYYLTSFTRYLSALQKAKLHTIDKSDVLGADDGSRKSNLLSGSKTAGTPSHDAFNLGRRIDLLKNSNQTALSSYLAEEDKSTHYLEFPFRNFNLALIDNASAEYSFLTTFFAPSVSYATISRHFSFIFAPTFALGQQLTKTLVQDTYDCLGILLCVRLNQHFAFELQRRKIPACDGYINATSMALWPRFQIVMDAHITSLRTLSQSLPANPRAPSASEAAKMSAAPHFLTQRFAQLLGSILSLSTEAADEEPVGNSLARLRAEMRGFLERLAKGKGGKRERFLGNNYALVLTIVGSEEGKLASEQRGFFEGLRGEVGE